MMMMMKTMATTTVMISQAGPLFGFARAAADGPQRHLFFRSSLGPSRHAPARAFGRMALLWLTASQAAYDDMAGLNADDWPTAMATEW